MANEIEEFFKANELPSSARKIAQTLERIRIHAKLLSRLETEIGEDSFWKSLEI